MGVYRAFSFNLANGFNSSTGKPLQSYCMKCKTKLGYDNPSHCWKCGSKKLGLQ
jgi:PHP family Zn ribbon phosphoesterase